MSNALALALAWAERGVKVFPLGENKMPLANCRDCRQPGHQPVGCRCAEAGRPCHGFYAATSDPALLRLLFGRPGAVCVGIATGASGLIAVDCDVLKPGAKAPLRWEPDGFDEAMQQELVSTADLFEGEDFCTTAEDAAKISSGVGVYSAALAHRDSRHTDTWTVVTPSGGVHYVYASVDADALAPENRAFPLVDVKTGGSYIVAAGSVVPKGEYRHVRGAWPPAEAPQWLVDHLDRPARRASRQRQEEMRRSVGDVNEIQARDPEWYLETVLHNAAKAVRNAPLGQVYDTIRRKTWSVAPFVKGGGIALETAVKALEDAVPSGAEARVPDVRRCLEGALHRVHSERVVPVQPYDVEEVEEFEFELDEEDLPADWEETVRQSLAGAGDLLPEVVSRYLEVLRMVETAKDQAAAVRSAVAAVGSLLENRTLAGDAMVEHLVLATSGLSAGRVRELASEGIRDWRRTRAV